VRRKTGIFIIIAHFALAACAFGQSSPPLSPELISEFQYNVDRIYDSIEPGCPGPLSAEQTARYAPVRGKMAEMEQAVKGTPLGEPFDQARARPDPRTLNCAIKEMSAAEIDEAISRDLSAIAVAIRRIEEIAKPHILAKGGS